jgi:hypothetical protein
MASEAEEVIFKGASEGGEGRLGQRAATPTPATSGSPNHRDCDERQRESDDEINVRLPSGACIARKPVVEREPGAVGKDQHADSDTSVTMSSAKRPRGQQGPACG